MLWLALFFMTHCRLTISLEKNHERIENLATFWRRWISTIHYINMIKCWCIAVVVIASVSSFFWLSVYTQQWPSLLLLLIKILGGYGMTVYEVRCFFSCSHWLEFLLCLIVESCIRVSVKIKMHGWHRFCPLSILSTLGRCRYICSTLGTCLLSTLSIRRLLIHVFWALFVHVLWKLIVHVYF